jgi:peptidoglycan/LPS O-acetylase OafA/YrhL
MAGVARLVKRISAHTFSLYLYHAPLLVFFAAVTWHDPSSRLNLLLIVSLTLLAVFALSIFTEDKRPALRRWLGSQLGIKQTRSR